MNRIALSFLFVLAWLSFATAQVVAPIGPGSGGLGGGGGGAPSGPAGGSLKGTYPNPGLADINSIATSLAIGGCTIGTNGLCVTGTSSLNGATTINLNAAAAPTPITGTALQVVGADATVGRIQVNSFGAIAAVSVTRANGTGASPTAVLSGDQIGGINAYSFVTSAAPAYVGPVASYQTFATQNHTSSAMGSKIVLATIPNNSTTLTTVLTANQDQSVNIAGSVTVAGTPAQFVSGGTGSIAPFSIPSVSSVTGTVAAYATTAEHMLSNNWSEQNVLSIWSQHDAGYSAINFLSSGKGAEFGAIGYGNHTTGVNVFSRRVFIEAAGYGLGGGTVTFTNGSAVIAGNNNFEVGQSVVFTVSGGTLPTNFTANNVVCVIATGLSSTQFEVANTCGGAAVVAGSAGTGTPSVAPAPAEFVLVQTGSMGGVSGSYIRQYFRNDGNIYIGGVDAHDTPAIVIPRTGGIGFVDTNTKIRLLNSNMLFESYTNSTSSGFAWAGNNGSWTNFMVPTANGGWQFGGPNAGAPVAQVFSMQSGSGSNAVGANYTIIGSLATGNVNSGDIIFQTGGAIGASGNTLATATTALTIKGVTQAVVTSALDAGSSTGGALQVAGGASVAKRFWIPAISTSAGLQTAVLCQSSGGEMIADSVACLASGSQFKNIIGPMESGALAKLMTLPIDRWTYKPEGQFISEGWTRERIGPIAQDVAAMDKRLAGYDKDGNIRTYSTEQLLGFTIKAVQELKSDNDNLRTEVEILKRASR